MQIAQRFSAQDEQGGRYNISVVRAEADGQTGLWADDGHYLVRIESGVYEMVDAVGVVRLTSDDPDAP
jgi:hypothetical protein